MSDSDRTQNSASTMDWSYVHNIGFYGFQYVLHVFSYQFKILLKESILDEVCDYEIVDDISHRNYWVTWLQMVAL
jgi:hypothetical protein